MEFTTYMSEAGPVQHALEVPLVRGDAEAAAVLAAEHLHEPVAHRPDRLQTGALLPSVQLDHRKLCSHKCARNR